MNEALDYATLAGVVAIPGFLWNLHRDMRAMDRRIGDLAERIAKLEGSVEVLLHRIAQFPYRRAM